MMEKLARRPRASLAELAYEALVEAIFDRRLPPGTRLKIEELAESLDMSITPVREALSRAVALEIIELRPGRTYVVAPAPTEADVHMLFATRAVLETAVSSTTRPTPERIRLLRENLDRQRELCSSPTYDNFRGSIEADHDFHELLVASGENRYLLRAWQGLHSHLRLSRLYGDITVADWATHALAEHVVIVDALEEGDTRAATSALRDHLKQSENRLSALARAEAEEGDPSEGRLGAIRT